MARFYNPVPVWDYWDTVAHLPRYRSFDLTVLWAQHNEHRILFPEIVFAADYLLLHGRELLPVILSCLCYFGTGLAIAWALLAGAERKRFDSLLAVAVASIVLGWRGSAVVLAIPFLLQWTMVQFATISALACLARARVFACIVCAVIATYSSGNGMLLWPLLVGIATLLRLPRRDLVALAAAAVVSIGAYFVGYQHSQALDFANLIHHPLYLGGFVASYLSVPFGVRHYGTLSGSISGVRIGLFNLALLASLLVVCQRRRLLQSPPAIVLLGYSLCAAGTALLTAAGRMNAADPLYVAATASRYATVPLANWAALAGCTVWLSARLRRSPGPLPLIVASLVLFFACRNYSRLQSGSWLQFAADRFADQQWAALSVENGLLNPETNAILYPDPQMVDQYVPLLRRDHLSIFYGDSALGRTAPVAARRCPGEVTYTVPLETGLEAVGWYRNTSGQDDSGRILITDSATSRIVGLGRKLPAGLPPHLRVRGLDARLAWVGFVSPRLAAQSFASSLLLETGARSISFGRNWAAPRLALASRSAAGSVVPIRWNTSGQWARNRIPAIHLSGNAPAEYISSWVTGDEDTGTVVSSAVPTPRDHCLVWPLLYGPSTENLSASVWDTDAREAIVEIPRHVYTPGWHYWKILIPESVRNLEFHAEDRGKERGEWMAVGEPLGCR